MMSTRLAFRHVFTLLVLGVVPAVAQGNGPSPGGPPAPPTFPETPLGASAKAMVDLLNAGKPEAAAAYVRTRMPEGFGLGMSAAKLTSMIATLVRQSGGFQPVRIMDGPEGSLRVFGMAPKAGLRVGLEFTPDPANPSRLRHFGIHPMEPESPPWTTGEVSVTEAVRIIGEQVARAAAEERYSGTVLVARGDSIVLHRAFGYANREQGVLNDLQTGYGIASIGKMFTAVSIARLVEAGRLRFEDTLGAVLPNYPNPAARGVTIHQLLTHTAGIADPFANPEWKPGVTRARQVEWFPLFAEAPLAFTPGERFEYSNGGYFVLGAIIERLTDVAFGDRLRHDLFQAAGMAAATEDALCATGYLRYPESDPLRLEAPQPNTGRQGSASVGVGSGAGGACLTALDMFRFVRALRNGNLLSPALTEQVVTGKVPLDPRGSMRYGYGFFDMPIQGGAVHLRGHSGGGEGSGQDGDVQVLWEADWTIIVLGNMDTPAARSLSGRMIGPLSRAR